MSSFTQIVTMQEIIYQNAGVENPEYRKIQSKIKQKLNISVPVESLKHMIFLYREIMKIR